MTKMMKRLVKVFVIVPVLMIAVSAYAGVVKTDVCHITGTFDFGNGEIPVGHIIDIADPAYPAHLEHGDPEVWARTYDINGNEYCTAKVEIDECMAWIKTQLDSVFTSFDDNETAYQNNNKMKHKPETEASTSFIVYRSIHRSTQTTPSNIGYTCMLYECKQAQEVDGEVTGVVTYSGRYTWIDENDVKQYSDTPLTEAQYNKCKEDIYLHEPQSN